MPVEQRSFAVTEAYRARVTRVRDAVDIQTRAAIWPVVIDDLDDGWADRQTAAVATAQTAAVRLSQAYLAVFLTSEFGTRTAGPELETGRYVGVFPDGRELRDALRSPIIGTLAARKEGLSDAEAMQIGLARARRMTEAAIMFAARESLRVAMATSPFVEGWERAVVGTCGGCMGSSGRTYGSEVPMMVHPNCKCVSEPVVRSSRTRYARESGSARFAAMSAAEQDDALGSEAAYAVRNGLVGLGDLVGHERIGNTQDVLVQRPLDDVLTPDVRAEVAEAARQ